MKMGLLTPDSCAWYKSSEAAIDSAEDGLLLCLRGEIAMNAWFRTAKQELRMDDLFAYIAQRTNIIESERAGFYKEGWSYFVFINDGTGTFGTYISPYGHKLYDDPIDAMKAADFAIDKTYTRLATGDQDDNVENVQEETSPG